ncbi:MAG TPA: hypothetical protein VHS29_04510 [Candidatus Acidoferrales bacterium]|jgi:hypothetical protein|nr:hypothetical protein [Candidatus Acidoferrales bacterium]
MGMSGIAWQQFYLLRPTRASYIIGAQYKGVIAFIDPQRNTARSTAFAATHRLDEVKDAKAL